MYNFELRPARKSFWNSHSLLEHELDKFFDSSAKSDDFHAPSCEVVDADKEYAVSMDIPGMKKEEISIEIKDNHLYVTGERKFENKSEKQSVLRTERRYGKFSRIFTLPQDVRADGIEAKFENGVLDIILPKEEKTKARKIAISNWQKNESDLQN